MNNHNPTAFYAYMNERRIDHDSMGLLQKSAGALKSSDTDMSDTLNDDFDIVIRNEETNTIPKVEFYEELQPWKILISVSMKYKCNSTS